MSQVIKLGSGSAPGTFVETLTGNVGGPVSPVGGNINIVTENATVVFSGATPTLTQDFGLDNLFLGSDGASLTSGSQNVAFGLGAAAAADTMSSSCFIGYHAGFNAVDADSTTAVGHDAMFQGAMGGSFNTAIGASALSGLFGAGSFNTCIGQGAGSNYTNTESSNLCIDNNGVIADNNTIRIGANGTHLATFIAGIDGVDVGSVATVVTEDNDQLGTAVITAGSGITVTPGANAITIATTGVSTSWSVITADQTAVVNNGYFCNKAGTLALALPAASAVGTIIEVYNQNTATGIQFTQAAGQQIFIGNTNTTLGAGGTLTSSSLGDALKIVCSAANTTWRVVSSMGNWSVV